MPSRSHVPLRVTILILAGLLPLAGGRWAPAEPPRDEARVELEAGSNSAAGSEAITEADSNSEAEAESQAEAPTDAPFTTKTLRGRVVFLADAMKRRLGVQPVEEARERVLALETSDGKLHPIVEDVRGRALRVDPRLRQYDLELLVRQYRQAPMVQIIRMARVKEDGVYELDYWCDVCAIAMFELKPCDCCQDPIRLRERKQ